MTFFWYDSEYGHHGWWFGYFYAESGEENWRDGPYPSYAAARDAYLATEQ